MITVAFPVWNRQEQRVSMYRQELISCPTLPTLESPYRYVVRLLVLPFTIVILNKALYIPVGGV
jgi:hypothetical protein